MGYVFVPLLIGSEVGSCFGLIKMLLILRRYDREDKGILPKPFLPPLVPYLEQRARDMRREQVV